MQATSTPAADDNPRPDGPATNARNARMVALAAENRFGPHSTAWPLDVLAND
ncbi:hypothetical protein [Streptomyces sp. SLBN-8D4]|uniref:hypothetical protein n=1 Tax=Streptomyces sp. SLBN-8D4 TaxID=3377728 RepID=UPI003C7E58AB